MGSSSTSPPRSWTATTCCRGSLKKPSERSSQRCHEDHDDQWGAEPDRPDRRTEADKPRVEDDPVLAADGLGDDERGAERRREQLERGGQRRRELSANEQQRADGLEGDRERANEQDDDPGRAHRLHSPARQTALAAITGTPGRASGRRTRATAPPASAALISRRVLTTETSKARKSAGKAASRPSRSGLPRRAPPKTPRAVAPAQHG